MHVTLVMSPTYTKLVVVFHKALCLNQCYSCYLCFLWVILWNKGSTNDHIFILLYVLSCLQWYTVKSFSPTHKLPNSQGPLYLKELRVAYWSMVGYLWSLQTGNSVIRFFCGIIFQSQTSSLHLKIELKLSLLIKLRFGPWWLCCYASSHDALSFPLLLCLAVCLHLCPIINT